MIRWIVVAALLAYLALPTTGCAPSTATSYEESTSRHGIPYGGVQSRKRVRRR